MSYAISDTTAQKIDRGEVLLPEECLGKPILLLLTKRMGTAMRRLQRSVRKKPAKKKTVLRSNRKQYGKKNVQLRTLAHVASTFVKEPLANVQTVASRIQRLLRDKLIDCPHRICENRILLKAGLEFGSLMKCRKCNTEIYLKEISKRRQTILPQ